MKQQLQYPGKSRFAVCLTHDIDRTKKTYQCPYYFLKELYNFNFKNAWYHLSSYFHNPYWTFDTIMELEKFHNIKSTFFFLQEQRKFPLSLRDIMLFVGRYNIQQKKITELIQKLDAEGWEIGVHGSYHSYDQIKLLTAQKQLLERIVGHKIKGIRQHYLNFDFEKTWELQKKAGFQYDSSFGLTRGIGFKELQHKTPFKPFSKEGDRFMVFPIALMDSALPQHLIATEELWKKIIALYDLAEQESLPLVIIWHNTAFSKKDYPGYFELYEKLLLEGKKRNTWFCTLGELYDFLNAKKTSPPKRFSKHATFKSIPKR
ncbi:polysaccharide deacetylase family protein [Candidatus Woesearchaeota archaeon]|nr:polysaccharide deacetylase family protein [Candidatus Woesearchaeota archaeon]